MELLTSAEMGRADALAVEAGIPGFTLMSNAGRAVADAAMNLAPAGEILVVAGPGNNGGDGFVAATELAGRGRQVKVMLLGDRARLKGDAARAAAGWSGEVVPADAGAIGRPDLVIDALFGAGLDRVVRGEALVLIRAINDCGAPVLAVDLPSGVNGTTGEVMGEAIGAAKSVTFFRRKPGHLLLPGRLRCGTVRVAQIGIPASVLGAVAPQTFENVPRLWRAKVPVPRIDGHKYSRGHAVVVSGGIAATGAARMAARAALRGGAGLVTVASPLEALAVNAAALTAVMVRPVDGAIELAALLADRRLNACVLGPGAGVGPGTRDLVLTALGDGRGVVLDADALTSFADAPAELFEAIAAFPNPQVVMTPHEGEFSRVFSSLKQDDHVRSKLERARLAAQASGAVVLLKGPDTVIAAPDGRAAITANAPPWLATAGSGDVLSGIIGGLLAQSVPAFEAAAMAAWLHGEAGREAGPGLIAEDLPEVLPHVLRRLFAELGAV